MNLLSPMFNGSVTVKKMHNVDVARRSKKVLGATPAPTVDGTVLTQILR